MDMLVKTLFGRAAEDLEYYQENGYPHAVWIENEDAMHVALQTATGRHKLLNHVDLYFSPPYPEFQCAGYMALKNEQAAADIEHEIVEAGMKCFRAKDGNLMRYQIC